MLIFRSFTIAQSTLTQQNIAPDRVVLRSNSFRVQFRDAALLTPLAAIPAVFASAVDELTQNGSQGNSGAQPSSAQIPAGSSQPEQAPAQKPQPEGVSSVPAAPAAPTEQASPAQAVTPPVADESEGKQSKRILWVIPNYRAVSANAKLPPLTVKDKFWLATQDSFDYSAFLVAGVIAGSGQARNSTAEFRQGAAGFGRYYWHSFVDQAIGNYLTETIVPVATRDDPRYYTLGHGGFFRRSVYSVSRLLITRTDGGGRSFNFSEIVGNGAGAGISNLYYPRQERTWTKTGQKWVTQVALDGVFNILKEFWPDINHSVFRGHY